MNNFAGFGVYNFGFGAFVQKVHGGVNFGSVTIASFHFADSLHEIEEEGAGALFFGDSVSSF